MKTLLLAVPALLLSSLASAEGVAYQVRYSAPNDPLIHVTITWSAEAAAMPLAFVMPRAIPGGYTQQPYDEYVLDVRAFGPEEAPVSVARESGPRWSVGQAGDRVVRIEYAVDVSRMEQEILAASDASKRRVGYLGLLGYSLFGYIEGMEERPVSLLVEAPKGWPVFLTLAPKVPAATERDSARATSFYALADSQIVMGPQARFRAVPGGTPLFLVVYAEAAEDLETEGSLAREALDRVIAYFGPTPFTHYTVYVELLKPITGRHEYGFSMEHLDSGTFFLGVDRAVTAESSAALRETNLFNYAHHMAHSWVPKRAYGEQYFPHSWEIAPIIDTVWFNEGFGRYAAIDALSDGLPRSEGDAFRGRSLSRLRSILDSASPTIRRLPLVNLSRVASLLYSRDFRIGMNTFARGALMADEMDSRIRERTAGVKRLRDALRFLPTWVTRTGRGFRISEFAGIIREATGVDVEDILEQWLAAPGAAR